MIFATMTKDTSKGKLGQLCALPIHTLDVYQNMTNKKTDQVTTLIQAGGVSAQFQGTSIHERLVQCVQLSQKELIGCKELTLMICNTGVYVQDA